MGIIAGEYAPTAYHLPIVLIKQKNDLNKVNIAVSLLAKKKPKQLCFGFFKNI
tara:strand:+ start:62 stop:220 length:159 start_codon:yes stop_codon:yes gene_type:complete